MLNLKKWSRGLLAITLAASAAALQAREMVSVAKAQINMRAGAGTQHATLWTLTRGYPLEVTGRQGQWYKVRDFENDVGWVYRPLVGKTPHVVVKSRVANVRSAPGTRSRILGKADHGEVLRTLEHRNDWVRVQREGGLKGWIARRLLWGW
ncbi:MAG: SH3 domain-containing protein [Rhodoferax sp.]|uniref:SH3 domain-containing protein n=1 Tax=Rhodoferax sp. TaxID=50421 RepID=UPI0008C478C0|nr:SH3 domain-containing protein [Rhodoferax sp.]MDP2680464.1 SH3 domain-containing protein [Rhodoferax sp.]OGB53571.1 MAG: peptide-binding protein [Burkholderiales bacterium RIFOXYD12_FULL_59_19]OGB82574.1 MAG: peptide-binding protein [Burkholderiales bacterium RIFOXYD2_FULL_59_8]